MTKLAQNCLPPITKKRDTCTLTVLNRYPLGLNPSGGKIEFTVRYTRQITALIFNISIKIHRIVCIKQT